jgi:hypothetical protein
VEFEIVAVGEIEAGGRDVRRRRQHPAVRIENRERVQPGGGIHLFLHDQRNLRRHVRLAAFLIDLGDQCGERELRHVDRIVSVLHERLGGLHQFGFDAGDLRFPA